ncbi:uncharacterized protein LOC127260309 [Andrographis paniculata]|uniref:uncharacterized protein LOC127260309 n=1 Tax=Andrographis paniculata TaxID=175694 RepID=UPI0021E76C4B|nr:uncharacterized protein LOC127260309 [Andrographis paniculata]
MIAAYYLEGLVKKWWNNEKASGSNLFGLPCEAFKAMIRVHFYRPHIQRAKEDELSALVQGTMTVEEYFMRFNELAAYAPDLTVNDRCKLTRFVGGLNRDLQWFLDGFNVSTLKKAYKKAANIYRANQISYDERREEVRREDKGKGNVSERLKNYRRKDHSGRFLGTPYASHPKFIPGNLSDSHGGPTVCSRCGNLIQDFLGMASPSLAITAMSRDMSRGFVSS